MPPKVADWLMFEGAGSGREEESNDLNGDIRSIFRPFNMHRMEVSFFVQFNNYRDNWMYIP